MKMSEKIVGHMEFIDNLKYLWCSSQEKVIAPTSSEWVLYTVIANNEITVYDSRCEWDTWCFNYECKYNHDKNVTVHKHFVKGTPDEKYLSEENILKIRKNLEEMSKRVI